MPADDPVWLKTCEYTSLREEMIENRRFALERPLIIVTAVGVASFQLSNIISNAILLPILNIILLVNLWFSVSRIRNNARIAAYIEIVLEPESKIKYIGWEKSLRRYRIWKKVYNKTEQEQRLKGYFKENVIPDATLYFLPLFIFHSVLLLTSVIVSGYIIFADPLGGVISWSGFLINFFITFIVLTYFIMEHSPFIMKRQREEDRARWKDIFSPEFDEIMKKYE